MGFSAYRLGTQAAQAEALADSVGSNCPGAANVLYRAARLLADEAHIESAAYKNRSAVS